MDLSSAAQEWHKVNLRILTLSSTRMQVEQCSLGKFKDFQFFTHHHHFALVTKLTPTGSIMSDIKSSSNVLNRFCNSGILLNHMAITKRSKCIFCILLHNIERKCVVVKSEFDEVTISTFPNMVEHD